MTHKTGAATRGNTRAQLMLAKMYLDGEGVDRNAEQAEYWLNRTAIEGNSEAQFLLGKLYHSRNNRKMAGNWLAKSAAQGYEDAIHLLHFMENIGFQMEESLHQRPADLHQLAGDGDGDAQYQLSGSRTGSTAKSRTMRKHCSGSSRQHRAGM